MFYASSGGRVLARGSSGEPREWASEIASAGWVIDLADKHDIIQARILQAKLVFCFRAHARNEQKRWNLHSGNIRNALFLPDCSEALGPGYEHPAPSAAAPPACTFYFFPCAIAQQQPPRKPEEIQ
jgi:hypothetical protein